MKLATFMIVFLMALSPVFAEDETSAQEKVQESASQPPEVPTPPVFETPEPEDTEVAPKLDKLTRKDLLAQKQALEDEQKELMKQIEDLHDGLRRLEGAMYITDHYLGSLEPKEKAE